MSLVKRFPDTPLLASVFTNFRFLSPLALNVTSVFPNSLQFHFQFLFDHSNSPPPPPLPPPLLSPIIVDSPNLPSSSLQPHRSPSHPLLIPSGPLASRISHLASLHLPLYHPDHIHCQIHHRTRHPFPRPERHGPRARHAPRLRRVQSGNRRARDAGCGRGAQGRYYVSLSSLRSSS
jgi:hypothetical protein